MITRSAIFEGKIKEGFEARFFAEIEERLAPLWCQFPKATNVRLQRVIGRDDDAAPIVMIQHIDYPSRADIDAALASPIRTQARAVTLEILRMFEGRFYHVISEASLLSSGNPIES